MCWKVSFPKGMTCIRSPASSLDLPQKTVPSPQWHLSKQEEGPGLWQQTICKEATGASWCAQQAPEGEASPDFLPCLTTWSTEPGYRLSSSWHSGASPTSHKLWLDYSQLLSTTISSQLISLKMCPTGPQVLRRMGRTYAGRRDAGNAWEPVCQNVMEYLYTGNVKRHPLGTAPLLSSVWDNGIHQTESH